MPTRSRARGGFPDRPRTPWSPVRKNQAEPPLPRMRRRKGSAVVSLVGSESVIGRSSERVSERRDGNRGVGRDPSTLATGPVADAAAPARIHVGRGEHAQQGGPTARTGRPDASTHSSDGTSPFETI